MAAKGERDSAADSDRCRVNAHCQSGEGASHEPVGYGGICVRYLQIL